MSKPEQTGSLDEEAIAGYAAGVFASVVSFMILKFCPTTTARGYP
jgi:hypothetical protein